MGFISDEFGTYSDYLVFANGFKYTYHVKMTYDSSSEILTINPDGIKDMGILYKRHELYEDLFTSITLNLSFSKLEGGGGETLKTAYNTDGANALVEVEIFKLNTDTNDYDIYYNGRPNFDEGSYNETISTDVDTIDVKLIETGKQQLFLSRDKLNINLNSLTSVSGETVEAFVNEPRNMIYNPVDVYYEAKTDGNFNFSKTASYDNDEYYLPSNITANQLEDKLLMTEGVQLTSRAVYLNDTGSNKTIRSNLQGSYNTSVVINATWGIPQIEISMIMKIVGSTKTENIYSEYYFNTGFAGNITFNWFDDIDYEFEDAVDDTHNLLIYVDLLIAAENCTVSLINIQPMSVLNIDEKNAGVAATNNKTYLMSEALMRADQLLTDELDTDKLIRSRFYGRQDSEFDPYSVNGEGSTDGIINAWNLRSFPNKSFIINFRDLFTTCKNTRNVGMGYDRENGRFIVEDLEFFYQDIQIADFGVVDNLTVKPDKNINRILCGYDNKQKYDILKGAYEYNQRSQFSTPLKTKDDLNLRIPFFGDSVSMEELRKQKYYTDINLDTDYDDNIYFIDTDYSKALQAKDFEQFGYLSGFLGIDTYYNINFSPRLCLIRRLPSFVGYMWKNPGEKIEFRFNQKDVNISNITELDGYTINIEQNPIFIYSDKWKPYTYPETISFEAAATPEIIRKIDFNARGYFKATDIKDSEYYIYIDELEFIDFDRKVKVTGRKANINR